MPRIIVMADETDGRITYTERVSPEDFETEHFRSQLAERVAWAVDDAVEVDPRFRQRAEPRRRGLPGPTRFHRLD
jgi:hypothetical protein